MSQIYYDQHTGVEYNCFLEINAAGDFANNPLMKYSVFFDIGSVPAFSNRLDIIRVFLNGIGLIIVNEEPYLTAVEIITIKQYIIDNIDKIIFAELSDGSGLDFKVTLLNI